jgi:UDP-glucose 4-epimerase
MPDDHHSYGDAYDDATVLITGGAGFIGSHLAARLMSLDANVRVIDDLSTGHRSNLP